MRIQDYQFLSIWEIAHRWEGLDPSHTDVISVTSKVGERLRQLIWAATHAIHCYDVHGEFLPHEMLWFGFPKTKVAKQLDIAFHDPGAQRDLLKAVFLRQSEVKKIVLGMEELPEFWFDDWELQEAKRYSGSSGKREEKPSALRPDQQDRLKCQEIAKRLWAAFPDMTIADMAKRQEILVEGNGKAYKGKNTLRNWLKEVAPAAVRKRRGRPKKGGKGKTPS